MIAQVVLESANARWDAGLVEHGQECPKCGEERMDYLEWDDDGTQVTCSTCGHVYAPPII